MRLFIFLLTTLLFLTSSGQGAEAAPRPLSSLSGSELHRMCSSAYDTDYGFCAGYVSAVAHVLLDDSVGGYRACNHAQVKSQQYVDTFVLFAGKFPDQLDADAGVAVAAALARAFPCQE